MTSGQTFGSTSSRAASIPSHALIHVPQYASPFHLATAKAFAPATPVTRLLRQRKEQAGSTSDLPSRDSSPGACSQPTTGPGACAPTLAPATPPPARPRTPCACRCAAAPPSQKDAAPPTASLSPRQPSTLGQALKQSWSPPMHTPQRSTMDHIRPAPTSLTPPLPPKYPFQFFSPLCILSHSPRFDPPKRESTFQF